MAINRLGLVQLLKILLLLVAQHLPPRRDRLLDPLDAAEPDDGTRHSLVDPCQRHVRNRPVVLLGQLDDPPDDGQVRLARLPFILARAPVRGAKVGGLAGEVAAAQRRPGDEADARVVAEAVHLALLLAVQQVVVVLHADKLGPAVLLGRELQARKLRGPHAAGANVPHLARLDEVVQRLHGLLDGGSGVEAVDLEQVDVRGVEPAQRRLDLVEDGGARQAKGVLVVLGRFKGGARDKVAGLGLLAHGPVALGENNDLFARDVVLLNGLADNLLGHAVGVDVGRVPGVDATIVGGLEEREGLKWVSTLPGKDIILYLGLLTSSSSMTQGRVLLSPKLIHPKMGTETRRPELPSWRYSAFEFSRDSLSRAGRLLAMVMVYNK